MRTPAHFLIAAVFSLGLAPAACSSDPSDPIDDPDPNGPDSGVDPGDPVTDPLDGLPTGMDQWANLCAKNYNDTISEAFCENSSPPLITSFAELRSFLGFVGDDISSGSPMKVTATFHSTAISGRFVTPLNPRIFFLPTANGPQNPTTPQPDPTYNIIAFSRGELFVELASKDRTTGEPRFFLFRFYLSCESQPDGCGLADLLTPATESGWQGYTLYDDETIANTTLDCLRCHQPAGPSSRKFLRMQEQRNPWNHWFYPETPENIAAIEAFEAAHGGSRYGDFPALNYRGSRPINLQKIIQNNDFLDQPNEYDSGEINMEMNNAGTSPTWNALYAENLAGRAIPVPYVDNPQVDGNWTYPAATPFQPVLDPNSRVAAMIQGYKDTISGAIPRDQMPDIRDIWLTDALDNVYRPQPGLDARGIMTQLCSQCHNSQLDQSLSRANFNVETFDQLSRSVKDKAIMRMLLPDEDVRKMPPDRFYTLTDAERDLVIQELMQ